MITPLIFTFAVADSPVSETELLKCCENIISFAKKHNDRGNLKFVVSRLQEVSVVVYSKILATENKPIQSPTK